jgi:hypothetical protein
VSLTTDPLCSCAYCFNGFYKFEIIGTECIVLHA